MSAAYLVRMVNQIARQMEQQNETDAPQRTAAHLEAFWSPQMRTDVKKLAKDEDQRLSVAALAAIARLK